MTTGNQEGTILPYELRVEIWDLIDKACPTEEILDKLYPHAPPNVSQGQFRHCIRALRGKHTLGQKPHKG